MRWFRYLRILIVAVFAASVLLYLGVELRYRSSVDTVPPVFNCGSNVLEVSVRADDVSLLQGITATDDRDGDLTGRIHLVSVSRLLSDNTARATYAVSDSSSNMATMTRTLRYTDYHAPRFAVNAPLVFAPEDTIDLSALVTAQDVIDGDISSGISVAVDGVNYGRDGAYDITLIVCNSRGDYSSLPLKLVISSQYAHAKPLTLTKQVLYLERNAVFDASAYIQIVRGGGEATIIHAVDTSRPGSYIAEYRYTPASGAPYSAYLTVVVLDTEVSG